jgi:hypothetical protein
MSEREDFLSRWSRLKREAESQREGKAEPRDGAAPARAAEHAAAKAEPAAGAEPCATPTFDLTSLPAIDSITADTDIRIFLQSGVPAKLTEAALRRAWVTDPVIRDFIGIAENQWDFTNPATIPGFGPLQEMGASPGRLAQAAGMIDRSVSEDPTRMLETYPAVDTPRSPTGDPPRGDMDDVPRETPTASTPRVGDSGASSAAPGRDRVEAAQPRNLCPEDTIPRRRRTHGGALPR